MGRIGWEDIWKVVFVLVFLFLFSVLAGYTFSKKEFQGYYMYHDGTGYMVYINWNNAPDEVTFRSYNAQEALEVFNYLTGSTRTSKPLPPQIKSIQ